MVSDWSPYEWKRRIPFLKEIIENDYRLRKWCASQITKSANGRLTLKCDALNFEYDGETGEAYVWRAGNRYGGGKMELSDLVYLRDVIAKWVAEQAELPIPRYSPIDKRHKEIWRLPKSTKQ